MASIQLDMADYARTGQSVHDYDGTLDGQIIHELTRELNVTFDSVDVDTLPLAELSLSTMVEFTGSYETLIALIDRYADNPAARPGLIARITDIHN